MQHTYLWTVKERDRQGINRLVEALGISPFAAQLLINRGINDVEAAKDFFETPLARLSALDAVPGCREAAKEIVESLRSGERVMIYGDYDADGVTAASVMVKGLGMIGGEVDFYIPDRFSEGYDLNEAFIHQASEKGYGLVVTVDCGIKAFQCLEIARRKGLKIIVTDHHEPGEVLPESCLLINPKLNDDAFVKDLAGVGVALAVIRAVFREKDYEPGEAVFRELLELAAVGTVADAVALTGCNRIIVKHGLKMMGETSNIGLAALLEVVGLKDRRELEVADISFKIAPCINAVGRIGDANDAVSLLVSSSPQEAWEMARKLHRDNSVRQNLDGAAFLEVLERIEQEIDLDAEKVIVLASEAWHPGVIGITAAKVAQRFNKPTVMISLDGEIGKGSGRSPGDFDLNKAFDYCKELLIKFGGHKLAGGFSINSENILAFRRKINDFAWTWCEEKELCPREVEAEVIINEIDFELLQEIEAFKPFGTNNPLPVFLCRNVRVDSIRTVGKKSEHLKLLVSGEETRVDCIGFKMSEYMPSLPEGSIADVVFTPQLNTWNGSTKIEFQLFDIIPGREGTGQLLHSGWDEESSLYGNTFRHLLKGARVQYSGLDADKALLHILHKLKEQEIFAIVLFPLQSIAADFEKTLAGSSLSRRMIKVDCTIANETIDKAARAIVRGSAGLLITSFGSWMANESLRKSAHTRKSCMCIHLGHWGTANLPEQYIELAGNILADWGPTAVLLGSGREMDKDAVCSGFGISELQRGLPVPQANIRFSDGEDKLGTVRNLLSAPGKQLIFVNNGRKAVKLTREIRESGIQSFRIRHFHGGLLPSQKKLILEDFNFGTAHGLVASRNLEPYMVGNLNSVALFSFPLNIFDFNRFLIAPDVYLGYNNADLQESWSYVNSLCPGEALLQYISESREHGEKENSREFAERMTGNLQRNIDFGKRSLSVALAILGDNPLTGDFDREGFLNSWRYLEARREVEAFELLLETLGADRSEAAPVIDG